MKIIDITKNNLLQYKNVILDQLDPLEWGGSKMLVKKIKHNNLLESEHIVLFIDDSNRRGFLIGHGALLQEDIVKDTDVSPFVSAIFVSHDYRGKGYSLKIANQIEEVALLDGYRELYIVTKHEGLYEKIGYKQIGTKKNISGEYMRILKKRVFVKSD